MVLVYMQNAFIMEDVSVKLNKAIAAFTPIFFTWNCQFLIEIFLPYLCVFCDDGDDTQSKEENSCDAYIDNDPDDDQGDKEEQVYEAGNDDIYIMMKCLFVTKNHHFLLWVSCNHLNHP